MSARLRLLFRSPLTGYLIFVIAITGAFVRVQAVNDASIHRVKVTATADAARAAEVARAAAHANCVSTQHTWDAIHRVIDAATHPPSRAGTSLTAEQRVALRGYQNALSAALQARPAC